MAERSSSARILASSIKALEEQVRTALAACPVRQRFELDGLLHRLAQLKASAPSRKRPRAGSR